MASVTTQALEEFMAFVELGTSLMIATCDANKRCEVSRVGGARLVGSCIQVLVPLPEGERALANALATRAIALTAVHPTTYRCFQVKGSDAELATWPNLHLAAERHIAAVVAELVQLGLPAEQSAHFWSHSFMPLAFTPDALFAQTPGAGAGQLLST